MTDLPTQQELDAVAHFVEAVRELRKSPFFIEEYRSLSISMRKGDAKEKIKGLFPDPSVLQGMLVPFRRVWNQEEPCHYTKVINILKHYIPDFREFLDSLALDGSRSAVQLLPWFRELPLSVRDVVDLWLNTKYHHVGKSSRRGRFTRQEFDKLTSQIGRVLFEFYFLFAVQEAAIAFFNIQQCAESFLRGFRKKGLIPSFIIEEIPEESVERRTPGFTPDNDSPPRRVWCLRRRRHYDGFNNFLNIIGYLDTAVASLLPQCASFDEFTRRCAIVMEQTDNILSAGLDDFTHFNGCIDNFPTSVRNHRSRRGFVAKRKDGVLLWGEEYVPVLRDQFLEFREAFSKEPFV